MFRYGARAMMQLAATYPGGYRILANKYYVDEFYGAAVIKPLLAISRYFLEWFVDICLVGGAAWLLAMPLLAISSRLAQNSRGTPFSACL